MFKPLHSFVVLVLDPKPTQTAGGIEIPGMASASYRTGVVKAVGIGPLKEDGTYAGMPVAMGDRVLMGVQKDRFGVAANVCTITDDDGEEVVLANYTDIWGICEKAAGSHGPQLAIARA